MLGIIAVLVMLSALAVTSYYLSHRLYQGFVSFFLGMRFWHVLVFICALVLLVVLGFGRAMLPVPQEIKHLLGVISGYSMGVLLYLLLFTVIADLLLLIPRLMKLSFTSHHIFNGFVTLAVLLLTGITCLCGFINARQVNHVSYDISIQDAKPVYTALSYAYIYEGRDAITEYVKSFLSREFMMYED